MIAALLSIGCYAMILAWRRAAVGNGQSTDSGSLEQNFFHARATWFVRAAIGLLVAVGVLVGIARTGQSKLADGKVAAASASGSEATFPPCKAAGMFANAAASKRDQGMPREEMLRRYQPNEIMNRRAWGQLVNMVYDHPELSPEAIERAFTSHC